MRILTFDIEDWYNCDFIDKDFNWDRHEVRIYYGVNKILEKLESNGQKATFFCLGWIAQKHPKIIQDIVAGGHHVGCHSYQHQLSYTLTVDEFRRDTERAKKLLEDVSGKLVNSFRAPGFSIVPQNLSYFNILAELGFLYDASVFPAKHDFGGLPDLHVPSPCLIETNHGLIKEFPMNIFNCFGYKLVFSGGGYFRLFPYSVIKNLSLRSNYLMTYFHPRDFDPGQPKIKNLPLVRKYKSYVGLKTSFSKFEKYLSDFDFLNIEEADSMIDWDKVERIIIQ